MRVILAINTVSTFNLGEVQFQRSKTMVLHPSAIGGETVKTVTYVYSIQTMVWPVVKLRVVGIFSRIADEDEFRVKSDCILGEKAVMDVENFLYAFRIHCSL